MSKLGRELAIELAEKLPTFSSQDEAQQKLFAMRDKHLTLLSELAQKYSEFKPDYQPESLKKLEQWNIQLNESNSFEKIDLKPESFEICMAMYFGETVIYNTSARWIVTEYFLGRGKYLLGVQRELLTMTLYPYFRKPDNGKEQSLFRSYVHYFSKFSRTPLNLNKELIALVHKQKLISAILLYQKYQHCSLEEAKRYIDSL